MTFINLHWLQVPLTVRSGLPLGAAGRIGAAKQPGVLSR